MSSEGWQRLKSAQTISEMEVNRGIPYTLEELNGLTDLSFHTLIKVRRRQTPVDRQTLESSATTDSCGSTNFRILFPSF